MNKLLPPPRSILFALLLGLLLRSPFSAWAQYQVPLGQAAAYGLLSGGSITVQRTTGSALPAQAVGKAGASGSIGAQVAATAGVFAQGSGTVPAALGGLAAARSYCTHQSSTAISADLNGRTLGSGSYAVAGNALLSSGGVLTLTGDTATVIIFNIAGSLAVGSQAQIKLVGVLPRHVYWNLSSSLSVSSQAAFRGIALLPAGTTATLAGYQFGACALLSGGSITLTDISAIVGHNLFYAPQRTTTCGYDLPGQACVFARPGSELIDDGSFEIESCCPQGIAGLYAPSHACFWETATGSSPDYFHACANQYAGINRQAAVPSNQMTTTNSLQGGADYPVTALAQNSRATTGSAYAGLLGFYTNGFREYIYQQTTSSLTAGRRYYAEFSARLSPSSSYTVPALGMLVGPADASMNYPDPSIYNAILRQPTISGNPSYVNPSNPTAAPNTLNNLGWQRIGGVFTASNAQASTSKLRIVIGNFEPDAQAIPGGPGSTYGQAYYFIDNVTLSPLTEAGPAVTIGDCKNGSNGASVTLGTAPMPALVGATYSWTSSDGSLVSSQPNPTVNPFITTNYFLTVSIPGQPPYTSQTTVTVLGSYAQNPGANYASPAGAPYEIGTYGTTTYLDARPYGGTVIFDGQYHVLGTVHVFGGTFKLMPGTVFFVDGDSGLPADNGPDTYQTTIVVQEGELQLEGATLQASCPDSQWGGVWLYGTGVARTSQAGSGLRSRIQDAETGLNSRAGNQYYLTNTDFQYNNIGLYELSGSKTAQPGEGVQYCTFHDGGLYGIVLEGSDYANGVVVGGDYTDAKFAYNDFANLRWMGLYVSAGNGRFTSNTFRDCGWAGMASWFTPQAGPSEFNNNYVLVPGSSPLPIGGSNGLIGPIGIYGGEPTVRLSGNTIEGLPLSAGAPPRTGILYRSMSTAGPVQVSGNSVRNLEEGLATTTDDYNGSAITITKNTFTNNAADVVFYPFGTGNFGTAVSATIRCNSFINDGPGAVSQPIGIWLKDLAVINTGLGGNGMPGNGNEFPAAWWSPGTGTALKNDNLSANTLYYTRLSTSNETIAAASNVAVNTDMTTAPNGACGGTSPGVNNRPYAAPLVATTTVLDSLQADNLTASQQTHLLTALRSQPVQSAQLPAIEKLLTARPLAPASRLAAGLHLLAYYRAQQDRANTTRLRTWLSDNQPNDKGELGAYLQVTQAIDQMGGFLPGFRPLAEANRELLQRAATSGTTSARLACQLLRAYEPACACLLPAAGQPVRGVRPAATVGIAPHAQLAAYPNPASTVLHVPYTLPTGTSNAELLAYDALGRVVVRQAISAPQGELQLATQTWPAGLYQLALVAGGRVVGTQRVAISSY